MCKVSIGSGKSYNKRSMLDTRNMMCSCTHSFRRFSGYAAGAIPPRRHLCCGPFQLGPDGVEPLSQTLDDLGKLHDIHAEEFRHTDDEKFILAKMHLLQIVQFFRLCREAPIPGMSHSTSLGM